MILYLLASAPLGALLFAGFSHYQRPEWALVEFFKGFLLYATLAPIVGALRPLLATQQRFFSLWYILVIFDWLLPLAWATIGYLLIAAVFRGDRQVDNVAFYAGGYFFAIALVAVLTTPKIFNLYALYILPTFRLLFIVMVPRLIEVMRAGTIRTTVWISGGLMLVVALASASGGMDMLRWVWWALALAFVGIGLFVVMQIMARRMR